MSFMGDTQKSSGASTPFDWLSGGLFFGKNRLQESSIDSCKNVMTLLTGIAQGLDDILKSIAELKDAEKKEEVKQSANGSSSTPEEFLAARMARLRFLLYDERRISSQQHQQDTRRGGMVPTVAGDTLKGLTGAELHDLMPRLLENMVALPFESRKHTAAIFNYLLVSGLDGHDAELFQPIMESFLHYVESHFERIMNVVVKGHDLTMHSAPDVCLHFGSIYRSCLRHPSLYRLLVGSTERVEVYVFPFMDVFVHFPNFDVSSDSMESLKMVFTAGGDKVAEGAPQHAAAELAAEFLTRDYLPIFDERFNPKLLSDSANYMTRRVALQILSTVLLTRSNYNVMIQYVTNRANLILVMHLLRDTSPHITLDAFHVFKVFVANPNKPPEIEKILRDNQVKLCRYLATLHQDREASDLQFRDEKALIIATIEAL